mmetsp:Transcript_38543/g.68968  ORF Transcript_38543/g.68968 Transcript_38543/m.68968 type:complete len:445 (+) Transcript_38543:2282-3616(+)
MKGWDRVCPCGTSMDAGANWRPGPDGISLMDPPVAGVSRMKQRVWLASPVDGITVVPTDRLILPTVPPAAALAASANAVSFVARASPVSGLMVMPSTLNICVSIWFWFKGWASSFTINANGPPAAVFEAVTATLPDAQQPAGTTTCAGVKVQPRAEGVSMIHPPAAGLSKTKKKGLDWASTVSGLLIWMARIAGPVRGDESFGLDLSMDFSLSPELFRLLADLALPVDLTLVGVAAPDSGIGFTIMPLTAKGEHVMLLSQSFSGVAWTVMKANSPGITSVAVTFTSLDSVPFFLTTSSAGSNARPSHTGFNLTSPPEAGVFKMNLVVAEPFPTCNSKAVYNVMPRIASLWRFSSILPNLGLASSMSNGGNPNCSSKLSNFSFCSSSRRRSRRWWLAMTSSKMLSSSSTNGAGGVALASGALRGLLSSRRTRSFNACKSLLNCLC